MKQIEVMEVLDQLVSKIKDIQDEMIEEIHNSSNSFTKKLDLYYKYKLFDKSQSTRDPFEEKYKPMYLKELGTCPRTSWGIEPKHHEFYRRSQTVYYTQLIEMCIDARLDGEQFMYYCNNVNGAEFGIDPDEAIEHIYKYAYDNKELGYEFDW